MSAASTESATLEIGRVVRAHGLRGAVSVALHFKGSDALDDAERVILETAGGKHNYEVRHVGGSGAFRTLELQGVEDPMLPRRCVGPRY
jgi:ribosomal 30S subunit maturation factor RimM